MDFAELEAIEGLRWPWNSWPTSSSSSSLPLPIPLSILCTPLMNQPELPILNYDPITCSHCNGALNPYARINHPSRLWHCPFCLRTNPYITSSDSHTLPAELFPTFSTVEYRSSGGDSGGGFGGSMAIVFVVDLATVAEELRAVKGEILRVVERLPESVLVGLVTFDSMVRVHDLGFGECSRAVLLRGDLELSSDQIQQFLGLKQQAKHKQQHGTTTVHSRGFLVPISECDFIITTAIGEIRSSSSSGNGGQRRRRRRPERCTGAAISAAVGLLEGCSVTTGSRITVFASGPATRGPGKVVDSDLTRSIRTHRDLVNGSAPDFFGSRGFYERVSSRLSESSIVLDLFACSLDQTGAAEAKPAVERSNGFMFLGESFDSPQFRDCLSHVFAKEGTWLDATVEVVTTRDVKIRGALGPCVSLRKKNDLVDDDDDDNEGGTYIWKLGALTEKTTIAFFFRANFGQPRTAFFVQFTTRYRCGSEIRRRVTTAARRWVERSAPEVAGGFDQEAAAAVMARLAVQRLERHRHARDVIRWLDDSLIQFCADFGDYVPEDPSSFRLSSNLSLYPQFMYHLRRSQFVDVTNSTPDETAYARLALSREPVAGSVLMVQPALLEYSLDAPPVPVLLDVRSVSPDTVLVFDSYFCVVVHYGSRIAHWRRLGGSHESLRRLLEAAEADAEQLAGERVPPPRLVKCDQHSSQARFLLAKLSPSVTHHSTHTGGSDVIFTDDLSLQVFLDHLQVLAVKG